jgi:hypothetical protein
MAAATVACKDVFKDGEKPSAVVLMQKWVKLINYYEQMKK